MRPAAPFLVVLLQIVLHGCATPAQFAAVERLNNEHRQQRVISIVDRLQWADADYLEILEAAEAVEKLSATYITIRGAAVNLEYDPVLFELLQDAYLAAAREYREAREVIKSRWADFSPEEQLVLIGWDRDSRLFGQFMSDNFLMISDPATDNYTRAQLWRDVMTLMPYVLGGAEILIPLAKMAL